MLSLLGRLRPAAVAPERDEGTRRRTGSMRPGARAREFGCRTWCLETPLHSSNVMNPREAGTFEGGWAHALVPLSEEPRLRDPLADCVELC